MATPTPECAQLAKQIASLEAQIAKLPVTTAPEAGRLAQLAAQLSALREQEVAFGCYPPPPPPAADTNATVACTATMWTDDSRFPKSGPVVAELSVVFGNVGGQTSVHADSCAIDFTDFDFQLGSGSGGTYDLSTHVLDLTLPLVLVTGTIGVTFHLSTDGFIVPPLSGGVPRSPVIEGKNVDSGGNFVLVGTVKGTVLGSREVIVPPGQPDAGSTTFIDGINQVWLTIQGRLSTFPS